MATMHSRIALLLKDRDESVTRDEADDQERDGTAHEIINILESGSPDTENKMMKISALIGELQSIQDRFGDTCVYIREHGLSWGAVAMNRKSDDEQNGVPSLQEEHDKAMKERLEQVERLVRARMDALYISARAEAERDQALYTVHISTFQRAGLSYPADKTWLCIGIDHDAFLAARDLERMGLVSIKDSAQGPLIRWRQGRGVVPSSIVEPKTNHRFGDGFEAAFNQVVAMKGSPYEGYTPAEDPAEIVTDMHDSILQLRGALVDAKTWHEQQDKALSKSGRADAGYYWFRAQHQEQISEINEALKEDQEPKAQAEEG